MDFQHLIDPNKSGFLTATAAGSLLSLIVTRKYAPAYALSLIVCGLVTSWVFTIPLAEWRGWGPESYAPIGFLIGVFAMMVWTGMLALFDGFMTDPRKFLEWLWKLWRGTK